MMLPSGRDSTLHPDPAFKEAHSGVSLKNVVPESGTALRSPLSIAARISSDMVSSAVSVE